MRNQIAATLFMLAASSVAAQNDGPFGVAFGSDPTNLPTCEPVEGNPGLLLCSTLPKTHSAFEAYTIRHAEGLGVCFIKGIGKDIGDNGYGLSTKGAADELAKQLAALYGQHTSKMDGIVPSALWSEADEFLMSIRQKERYYAYSWSPEEGFVGKNGINMIFVAIGATARDTGYITIEYYGANHDDCEASLAAAEAGAL